MVRRGARGIIPVAILLVLVLLVAGKALEQKKPVLLVISPAVADYQVLLANLPAATEVLVLDPARDGLAQIAEAVQGRRGLSAIHLVTHGAAGEIELGGSKLTWAGLEDRSADLAAIGAALAPGGDILVYGCDVGAGVPGELFIAGLSALTGADVAASNNPTGGSAAGGDWVLERTIGTLEAILFADAGMLAAYPGLLLVDLSSADLTGWTPVTPANGQHDYLTDQQTASGQSVPQDIVGDNVYRSAYVKYDWADVSMSHWAIGAIEEASREHSYRSAGDGEQLISVQ